MTECTQNLQTTNLCGWTIQDVKNTRKVCKEKLQNTHQLPKQQLVLQSLRMEQSETNGTNCHWTRGQYIRVTQGHLSIMTRESYASIFAVWTCWHKTYQQQKSRYMKKQRTVPKRYWLSQLSTNCWGFANLSRPTALWPDGPAANGPWRSSGLTAQWPDSPAARWPSGPVCAVVTTCRHKMKFQDIVY